MPVPAWWYYGSQDRQMRSSSRCAITGEALTRQAILQDILGCALCTSVSRRWAEHSRSRAFQDKGRAWVGACQLHGGASATHRHTALRGPECDCCFSERMASI